MKARLLTPIVDLLLDCFALLAGPDKSPGIVVSTIPELAAALMREDSGIIYAHPLEDDRHDPRRAVRTPSPNESVAVCVSADGPPVSYARIGTDAHGT